MSDSGAGASASHLDTAVERATKLTEHTLALFPVRVWRHLRQNNGFLLAAGVSYRKRSDERIAAENQPCCWPRELTRSRSDVGGSG